MHFFEILRKCISSSFKICLLLAKGRWWSVAGMVIIIVGLASHWPCMTDLSAYGLKGLDRERSTWACAPEGHNPLYFACTVLTSLLVNVLCCRLSWLWSRQCCVSWQCARFARQLLQTRPMISVILTQVKSHIYLLAKHIATLTYYTCDDLYLQILHSTADMCSFWTIGNFFNRVDKNRDFLNKNQKNRFFWFKSDFFDLNRFFWFLLDFYTVVWFISAL